MKQICHATNELTHAASEDWLKARSFLSGDRVALIELETGRSSTYRAWAQRVCSLASWLATAMQIKRGERIAIYASNSIAYLDVIFACHHLGAIAVPLNTRLALPELRFLLKKAQPRVAFFSSEYKDIAEKFAQESLGMPWLALDGAFLPWEGYWAGSGIEKPSSEALSSAWDAVGEAVFDAEEPWLFCSTGGTTGRPKLAALSRRQMWINAITTQSSWGLSSSDIALLQTPLFHIAGLAAFTLPLAYAGGTTLIARQFDPALTFSWIEKYGVTAMFGVPAMYSRLLPFAEGMAERVCKSLRFFLVGGAPCSTALLRGFWENGLPLKNAYGLTEAGPNNFFLPNEDLQKKPNSVGFPMMHLQARIVEPATGVELAAGEVGELWLRGAHQMTGYWEDPDESAKAFVGGDLRTGDLAYRDAEGYFFLVGRLKEMFISGGENIYPVEVEEVLSQYPEVEEAAVVGIPDPVWGEVGVAYLRYRNPERPPDEKEITIFCRERLAAYKIPREWVFLAELPRTGPGKIDKRILKEWAEARFTKRADTVVETIFP
jgi:fatty-acyl-CoA synthase